MLFYFLEFEIIEGMVMDDFKEVIIIMCLLSVCGIYLVMDDFGMGYLLLVYLK